MAILACGGAAGCGGSGTATSPHDSGNEGDGSGQADGEGTDAAEDAGEDAANDSGNPADGNGTDGNMTDGGGDAMGDASPDATGDAPTEATADAPSEATGTGDAVADSPPEASGDAGVDATLSPTAAFSTATIDAGAGNCGSATGVSATFSIQNTGSATLTVGASIGGTVFSPSPATLSVAPGNTGMITIKAVVPASATAGSALSGSLVLTTNDPAHLSATIPLSVTPTGATLAWASGSPTIANFGVQPNNMAAAGITLTLANTGNASASVTLGTPTDSQFSLAPSSGTIAAGATLPLTAGFTPNTLSDTTATSAIAVSGVVCGTSLTSVPFDGQGGVGVVTGWPTGTVDFGANPCGGAAPGTQTFTLANSGGVAAHVTAVNFTGTAGYLSSAAVGATVPAHGQLVVTLTAPAIPKPSAVPGSYGATVTYTTDIAGDTPHAVTLTEIASGAILAFDTSATTNFGNFGGVTAATTATEGFAIVNSGNADSSVTLTTTSPFGVAAAPFTVTAGASQPENASFAPQTYGPYTAAIHLVGTNLCQPAPSDLPLTGTGQAGGISLSTQSLAYQVNCGATATAQNVVVTNNGNASMTWTALLPNSMASDALYGLSPSTATLAAGQTSTIVVTPAAVAQYPVNTNPSAFADTITITTDIPNDTAHPVSLSETPLGDILSVQPTSLPFGATPVNTSAGSLSFVVTNGANSGSPTANVTLAQSGDTADFPLSTTSATAAPGGQSNPVTVTFNAPATAGGYTSNIDITTSDVLCAPLPTSPAVSATGTATEAGPAYTATSLNFNLVNCGSTAQPQQITATNTGNQNYTIQGLALGKGGSSYYSVSMVPASGIVTPAGGASPSVVITVTPLQIPATHQPVPDSATFSDILTIQTNANVATPNTDVSLSMGAQGIIITNNLASTNWAFGTVNFGSTGFFNNLIKNTGNDVAIVSLAVDNFPTIYGLQGAPVSVGNGSTTLSGTFTPPSGNGSWADTATLTVVPNSGAVFCEPLPSSWQGPSPNITLSGTAGNNPVISVSPSSLTFPSANCGGTLPLGEHVTITNNTSSSKSVTAGLGSTGTATGTYYTTSAASPSPVPGNGTSTITVTPTVNLTAGGGAAVGSSQYNDDLVITVGSTQYDIPISMTVNGVVIALNNGIGGSRNGSTGTAGSCVQFSYDYYSEVIGTAPFLSYNPVVTNNGNISGTVTASFTGWSAGDFTSTPTSTSVNPGSQQTFTLGTSDPGAPYHCPSGGNRGWYSGKMTFSSPQSCNAPVTVNIAGHYQP